MDVIDSTKENKKFNTYFDFLMNAIEKVVSVKFNDIQKDIIKSQHDKPLIIILNKLGIPFSSIQNIIVNRIRIREIALGNLLLSIFFNNDTERTKYSTIDLSLDNKYNTFYFYLKMNYYYNKKPYFLLPLCSDSNYRFDKNKGFPLTTLEDLFCFSFLDMDFNKKSTVYFNNEFFYNIPIPFITITNTEDKNKNHNALISLDFDLVLPFLRYCIGDQIIDNNSIKKIDKVNFKDAFCEYTYYNPNLNLFILCKYNCINGFEFLS